MYGNETVDEQMECKKSLLRKAAERGKMLYYQSKLFFKN